MITILEGDNLGHLRAMEPETFHSCVTDPPYGLRFMNRKWDSNVPSVEQWREVWRVLKSGAQAAQDANGRDRHNQRDGTQTLSLLGQVRLWPTPTAACASCGQTSRSGARKGEQPQEMHAGRGEQGEGQRAGRAAGGAGWWESEPDVGRVAHGVAARVDRLRALGNGQVPAVAALAWRVLAGDETGGRA